MGCGKSTVGAALAPIVGMRFVDMDRFIEKLGGESVADIFAHRGEAAFRELERRASRELASLGGCVVATGGGAVLDAENAAAFKSSGLIALIDVPLEVIALRLSGDRTRPLLQRPDKLEAMRALYSQRMPLYRAAADITVSNPDNRSEKYMAHLLADCPEVRAL